MASEVEKAAAEYHDRMPDFETPAGAFRKGARWLLEQAERMGEPVAYCNNSAVMVRVEDLRALFEEKKEGK